MQLDVSACVPLLATVHVNGKETRRKKKLTGGRSDDNNTQSRQKKTKKKVHSASIHLLVSYDCLQRSERAEFV